MQIIAKTDEGYLISASKRDVEEILTACYGVKPGEIEIGQKIPAIDYATTIKKFKALGDTYEFKKIYENLADFMISAEKLKKSVKDARGIEI